MRGPNQDLTCFVACNSPWSNTTEGRTAAGFPARVLRCKLQYGLLLVFKSGFDTRSESFRRGFWSRLLLRTCQEHDTMYWKACFRVLEYFGVTICAPQSRVTQQLRPQLALDLRGGCRVPGLQFLEVPSGLTTKKPSNSRGCFGKRFKQGCQGIKQTRRQERRAVLNPTTRRACRTGPNSATSGNCTPSGKGAN